jgi:hypothetical protein
VQLTKRQKKTYIGLQNVFEYLVTKKVKSIFTRFLPCSCSFVRQRNKKSWRVPKFPPLCSQKNSQSFFVNITGQICKLPCASVQTRQRGISFVPQEKISGLPFERVDIGARPADFLAMQRKNRQKVWK